jgi:hypothetical protein
LKSICALIDKHANVYWHNYTLIHTYIPMHHIFVLNIVIKLCLYIRYMYTYSYRYIYIHILDYRYIYTYRYLHVIYPMYTYVYVLTTLSVAKGVDGAVSKEHQQASPHIWAIICIGG